MDPLRPFAALIRTLRKSTTAPSSLADAPAPSSPNVEQGREEAAGALDEASLRSQIRSRLVRIGLKDPRLAREVFVETVLTAELGERLVHDPAFSDMVKRVAEHIAADTHLGGRLHALLQALSEEPPSA
jgi:hypothetical protein